jgi:uncharacterized protein YdhG (YjbR/CyaY superfamily)
MPKIKFTTIDDYIAAQPDTSHAVLERVRQAIRKGLPKAEETISYNIPAYKLGGKVVMYFAGWKQHYSVYPAGTEVVKMLKAELASYEISKGTIKFPLSEPVPSKLITKIANLRAQIVSQKVK